MKDIQKPFKKSIVEFMESGLEADLHELGHSKYNYKNKNTDKSRNWHCKKTFESALETLKFPYSQIEKASSILSFLRTTKPA